MLRSLVQKFHQYAGCCQMIGWQVQDPEDCQAYLRERVAAKLREWDGSAILRQYLRDLGATEFDITCLTEQVTEPPPAKDWEIGEAFAEVFLEDRHKASFPWPRSFDKRTPRASLPGPDLIGFHREETPRFLFGEVKSSSQDDPRSVVVDNDDSLLAQLRRLVNSQGHRQQLIQWLLVRVKDTEWATVFDAALQQYFNATRGRSWIVGVVVRGGTSPNANDLAKPYDELAGGNTEFDVALMAIYLPFHKDEWAEIVYAEGGNG